MSADSTLVCRESRPDDTEGILAVRNAIFPPITAEQWEAEPQQTASVALLDDDLVGAIPLSLRDFRLGPGVIAPSAWENAVGTRQDVRSRGIGSAMLEQARNFLGDKCDLLLLYRGGERTPGYQFYTRKTGHVDLCYMRRYVNTAPLREEVSGVSVYPGEVMIEREDEIREVFHSAWDDYGGHPARRQGYYEWALNSLIYKCLPTEFSLVCEEENGRIQAYALLGHRTGPRPEHNLTILELSTPGTDPEMARRLLTVAGSLAAAEGLGLATGASVLSPYRDVYLALGMEESHRWMMIMGLLLRGPVLFERWARAGNRTSLPPVRVWTPETEVVLNEGRGPEVALEMKDRTLIRWLCGRIDFRAAIADERITHYGASYEPIADLIPFHKWAYHALDYV